jgi:helicase
MSEQKVIDNLLKVKNWPQLTMTQQIAVENGLLSNQENFVLIAPTSAGKTGVAQLAALQAFDAGQRVLYLVPMKSLISDKEKDFQGLTTEIAGIDSNTADWEDANVVITTFEAFYKAALPSSNLTKSFALVVVDEFHLLYDKLRGFNVEKVITLLMEAGIRIICLSATFEDKKEIARWLHARVAVVPDEARKIQIQHGIIDISYAKPKEYNEELCKTLVKEKKEPYLVFCTSKDSTASRAKVLCKLLNGTIVEEEVFRGEFAKAIARKKLTAFEETLLACMVKGVAFHHSGLDQRLKNFVENKFANGTIKYLFATPGLAYGVNSPTRTVVLADTSFYDPSRPDKRDPVHVYMYTQMAGRAGRTGYSTDAYSFVVKKKGESDPSIYRLGKIERAVSVVGEDDYFRKAILELIYSGRRRDDQILDFFKSTFFNFQSENQPFSFIPFNLFKVLQEHVKYLFENGFIINAGVAGYKLTGLGEVTVNFLFKSSGYPLLPFVQLNQMLIRDKKVRTDFEIITNISSLFGGACLSKYPRVRAECVTQHFENLGIPVSDQHAPHYSAYAMWFGWLENKELQDIEENYKVYASQCPQVAQELFRLLSLYEQLAIKNGIEAPVNFKDFKERVKFGVTEEELPFVRLRGIGRGATRKMKLYCDNFLRVKPWSMKGSMLEIFEEIYKRDGEKRFQEVLQYMKGVGTGKKHELILDFVRKNCASPESEKKQ